MAFLTGRCWAVRTCLMLVLGLLLNACSSAFFYPDRHLRLTPDRLGLNYRDVSLLTKDGTQLHAWHLLPETPPKGVVLVLHGNAENISTHIHSVAWLTAAGYELLLLDYRGFGLSAGKAQLPEVFEDIDAAAQWLSLRSHTQQLPAYWLGQSIGATLSAYYLSRQRVEGLQAVVLDAPFADYRRIGQEKFSEFWLTWLFQQPLSWLIDNRFSPADSVSHWPKLPLLMFASSEDRVVPKWHTQALLQEFPDSVDGQIAMIETQAPHLATYRYRQYRQLTLAFLQQHTQLPLTSKILTDGD